MNKKTYLVTCILLAVVLVAVFTVGMIRIKALEGELEVANAVLADANAAVQQRAEMEAKLNESETYVGAIRTERDAVNTLLSTIQTERDSANTSMTAAQTERDAALAIADAVKVERDILNTRLDEALVRIAELEAEIEALKNGEVIEGEDTVEGEDVVEGEDTVDGEDVVEGEDTVEGEDVVEGEDTVEGEDAVEGEETADDEADAPVTPGH